MVLKTHLWEEVEMAQAKKEAGIGMAGQGTQARRRQKKNQGSSWKITLPPRAWAVRGRRLLWWAEKDFCDEFVKGPGVGSTIEEQLRFFMMQKAVRFHFCRGAPAGRD